MSTLTQRPPAPDGVSFYGGPFSNFVGGPIAVTPSGSYSLGLLALADIHDRPVVCARTVEHYFQAMKACRVQDFVHVLLAPGPSQAKYRGGRILLKHGWEGLREQVMYDALRAKFTQYRLFHDLLLQTGDRLIYENSPSDAVWGLWNARERDWTGLNLLGQLLMRVRDELRAAELEPEERRAA